jgi:hypothetical protein
MVGSSKRKEKSYKGGWYFVDVGVCGRLFGVCKRQSLDKKLPALCQQHSLWRVLYVMQNLDQHLAKIFRFCSHYGSKVKILK